MATPVLELIAENIVEALKNVSPAGGYNVTLEVERYKNPHNRPRDMLAVVITGDAAPAEDSEGSEQSSWVQTFGVLVYVIDNETTTNPADERQILAWADCVRALSIDKTRGGQAWRQSMLPPDFGDDFVLIKFDVYYDTVGDDPFTSIYT
jgi:hypothetical protein